MSKYTTAPQKVQTARPSGRRYTLKSSPPNPHAMRYGRGIYAHVTDGHALHVEFIPLRVQRGKLHRMIYEMVTITGEPIHLVTAFEIDIMAQRGDLHFVASRPERQAA